MLILSIESLPRHLSFLQEIDNPATHQLGDKHLVLLVSVFAGVVIVILSLEYGDGGSDWRAERVLLRMGEDGGGEVWLVAGVLGVRVGKGYGSVEGRSCGCGCGECVSGRESERDRG